MSNTPKAAMAKPNRPYDLDAAIAEGDNKPFRFTFSGREWSMPHMNDLNIWPLIEAADGGDLAAAVQIFEAAFGDDWEEFHAIPMPRGGITALFQQYTKHCGVELGELPASTG